MRSIWVPISCFPGEYMRKPVYQAILGISIVVAAVSLGVTLTRYLGLLAYSPKGTALAAAAAAGPGVPVPPPEEWNNLFAPGDGMKLSSRLPAVDTKAGTPATHSNFVLVGTIASSTPSARRAILWANGMKEPKAFREKEEVEPGAFLASVERDAAWITRGSEREKLEIRPVGSQAPHAGAPNIPARGGSATLQPASPGTVPLFEPGRRLTRSKRLRQSQGNRR
ncbi:MAG: hypothetical protein E4G97_07420 [Deltaproteobacteria bacterium]|nr:MAG: hypothetical protein E4G97_07420 [Deltaproteobacteria bacterium]